MVLVCLILGSDAGEAVDAASAEPVAGTFKGQDVGVVDDAVDHGCGDGLVTEHASPAGERQVRGQDKGGVLVAGGDELEEQVRGAALIADECSRSTVKNSLAMLVRGDSRPCGTASSSATRPG